MWHGRGVAHGRPLSPVASSAFRLACCLPPEHNPGGEAAQLRYPHGYLATRSDSGLKDREAGLPRGAQTLHRGRDRSGTILFFRAGQYLRGFLAGTVPGQEAAHPHKLYMAF